MAESSGWIVEPLGKGSKAGIAYEQGGGYSMRAPNGGSEYIQYHPGGGHHEKLYQIMVFGDFNEKFKEEIGIGSIMSDIEKIVGA